MARQRLSLTNGTSKGVVLDLIRSRGPISRVDLAEMTGLTQATMSTVVRQLLNDGLVVETGGAASRGGRPAVLLELDPDSRFAVGIQLGIESITYVVVNLKGALLARLRDTGVGGDDPREMVARVAERVRHLLEAIGVPDGTVVGLGVAAPGPVDLARGAIKGPPHLAAWSDVPLRELMREAFGLPVVLDNDANAAALGEYWSSGTTGAHAHATIYMGAGIGAGILIDGAVFRGASSNAGEIGQVVVTQDESGAPLTLEQVADAEAVVARALRSTDESAHLGLDPDDSYGSFAKLATAATHGDPFATRILEASANHVAVAVVSLANLFDLDSIALAGPASAIAGPLYVHAIRARIEQAFFARGIHDVTVALSTHASDAAAVGAATLMLQSELAPRTMSIEQPM